METKAAGNQLLKISAIALIACAIFGVVIMWFTSGSAIGPDLISNPEVITKAAQSLQISPDEMLSMMQSPEGVDTINAALMAVRLAMVGMAAIAALPRLIAGILGMSRSGKPEKNGFFLIWGVVLLVLGVIGLIFSGGLASINGVISLLGGVAAPICYIIGASQQKKAHLAMLSNQSGAVSTEDQTI